MRRLFNKRQKRMLAWVAGGNCISCGKLLAKSFHADHVIAIVNGGTTININGQALCAPCNLKKGSK